MTTYWIQEYDKRGGWKPIAQGALHARFRAAVRRCTKLAYASQTRYRVVDGAGKVVYEPLFQMPLFEPEG